MNINSPLSHHLSSLQHLWTEAFGDSKDFIDLFFDTAFHPDRCRVALEDDTSVAALYWFDCTMDDEKYAYLYAIATASSKQNQGICHKLMEDTHEHLASMGYKGTLLVPGESSLFDFYKTLSYETTCFVNEFSCEAAEHKITVRPISKEEYQLLRREYLPAHSVLQEGINLDFLEKQAGFYAGDDFILVARKEKGSLLGLELLGNTSVAPAVLYSLGFQKGMFRTPGHSKPFAMYCPLIASGLTAPAYFGLAFD